MAKPESWRLSADSYPFTTTLDSRFQDLDTMGHINNVATAGIFETARIRFHHHLGRHPQDRGVRWLVAAVSLNFVAEAHFPHDVTIGCAIGAVGNRSWTVMSAAFQHGECFATCDTVMVSQGAEDRRRVHDILADVMADNLIRRPENV